MMNEMMSGAQDSGQHNVDQAQHPEKVVDMVLRSANDFQRFPDKSKQAQKVFTQKEVARYDGEQGRRLYIIYKEEVYDITDYAQYHPGGPKPLKKYGGRDATIVMSGSNMAPWTYEVLTRFKIGTIEAEPHVNRDTPAALPTGQH